MKKLITLTALVMVTWGGIGAQAQPWKDPQPRYEDNRVYRDERGDYYWKVVERRVWIPEKRTRGIFGTRVIPGHYEIRHERVKVYRSQYKKHPYGQWKKRHKDHHAHDCKRHDRDEDRNDRWDD